MPHPDLSLVIPVYNGADSVANLVREITDHIDSYVKEIIFVVDGSPDNSEEVCLKLAAECSKVKVVSLRKNFGEHNAVMCGLNFVSGSAAAILDDDLQNPPHEIVKMYEELKTGRDVVYGRYAEKQHSFLRNLGSTFNDYVANLLIKKPHDLYLCSFKIISRPVIEEIIKYKGPYPYVDGLIFRVTNNISSVLVEHRERLIGASNYTLRKLVRLWLNMFLNFSVLPLRIITVSGFASFVFGVLFAIVTLLERLSNPAMPLGYASTIIAVMLFSGAQLMSLGLIGEYIGKSYLDQNGTPQWVIKTAENIRGQ
jgi:glycosyltransferase involved in cell wall biosynthesis